MELPESDVLGLIYQLLPGFFTAWIYFSFTAHPQRSPFERVVQALIFTGLIKAVVVVIRFGCLKCGESLICLGDWTADIEFSISSAVAIILGFVFVFFANNSRFHSIVSRWGISKRTSYPSEWYGTFHRHPCYVILHFKDGRRIRGWPFEWPDAPDKGHFVLMQTEWVATDNTMIPLLLTDKFLIPASGIEWVEFLKSDDEIANVDKRRHNRAVKKSLMLQSADSISGGANASDAHGDADGTSPDQEKTSGESSPSSSPEGLGMIAKDE